MFVLFIIAGTIGWLLGVWLPWWGIGGVLAFFAIAAYRGGYDGGLEMIPLVVATWVLILTMIVVGFAGGDVTWSMIFGFTKTVFMGG